MPNPSAILIGAGISGLITGYYLNKQGFSCTIIEERPRVGGAISTIFKDKWLVEEGPNSILMTNPIIKTVIDELGLSSQIIFANNDAKKRFILKKSKSIALPSSLSTFLKTELFSTRAKFRLFKEPFIKMNDNPDESLADFVERRLGKEFLDYAINPFVAGIYAGDPTNLSVRFAFKKLYNLEQTYGSLIMGQIKGAKARKRSNEISKDRAGMFTFKEGLITLPQALEENLKSDILLNTKLLNISFHNPGWEIEYQTKGKIQQKIRADKLILTLPAHKYSALPLPNEIKDALHILDSVNYPPVSVLALGFKKEDIAHPLDGFGILNPEKENRFSLGTLFTSSIFEHRAPDNFHLLTTFIGGARNPDYAALPIDTLTKKVIGDLKQSIGIKGEPQFVHHRFWPKSIPQYGVIYNTIYEKIEILEKNYKGLIFAGNFIGGISMSDCIINSYKLALELANHHE